MINPLILLVWFVSGIMLLELHPYLFTDDPDHFPLGTRSCVILFAPVIWFIVGLSQFLSYLIKRKRFHEPAEEWNLDDLYESSAKAHHHYNS